MSSEAMAVVQDSQESEEIYDDLPCHQQTDQAKDWDFNWVNWLFGGEVMTLDEDPQEGQLEILDTRDTVTPLALDTTTEGQGIGDVAPREILHTSGSVTPMFLMEGDEASSESQEIVDPQLLGRSEDTWTPLLGRSEQTWTPVTVGFTPTFDFSMRLNPFSLFDSWNLLDTSSAQEVEYEVYYYDEDEEGFMEEERDLAVDDLAKDLATLEQDFEQELALMDQTFNNFWENAPSFQLLTEFGQDTMTVDDEVVGDGLTYETWTSYRNEEGLWTTEHCRTVRSRDMFNNDIQEYICDNTVDTEDIVALPGPDAGMGFVSVFPPCHMLMFFWFLIILQLCCIRRSRRRNAQRKQQAQAARRCSKNDTSSFAAASKSALLLNAATIAVPETTSAEGEADHPNNGTYAPPKNSVDARPHLVFI